MSRTVKWMKIWEKVWSEKYSNIQKDKSFTYEYRDIESKNWIGIVRAFLKKLNLSSTDNILELGCGSGAFLSAIKSIMPDVSISGCDISKEAIDIVNVRLNGLFFMYRADTKVEAFFNCFDLVSAFSVFQYFDDYNMANKVLNNMLTYIKNKGSIFIGDVPDINKKKQDIKTRNTDGRKDTDHLYYNKDFFLSFASSNNLLIDIYDHVDINLPKLWPNREFRYSVIMRHKSER